MGKALQEEIYNGASLPGEKWIFVGRRDGDLTDLEATKRLFGKHKPTHVIHLAAMVGGLGHNMLHSLTFFTKNMAINRNVLQCCHETPEVKKCVSALSSCVYPDKVTYPIDESQFHMGPPHDSNFGFSYAKRMIDVLNRLYAQKDGKIYTSVIPCNTFGPHDNFKLEEAHVIPSLIHKVYRASITGEPLMVWGSGKSLRQFVYSRDIARLYLWALRSYNELDPINLCVDEDEEVSIGDMVAQVVKCAKFKGTVIFDKTKPEGQFRKPTSNEKLQSLLPGFQFTPFKEAMEETVNWFIDNYENARV